MKSEREQSSQLSPVKKNVKRWRNWSTHLWSILWNMKSTDLNSKMFFVSQTLRVNCHKQVIFVLGQMARAMIMMMFHPTTVVVLVVQGQLIMMTSQD